MGKENFESGNFFNAASIEFIMKIISVEIDIKRFSILHLLNDFWREKSGLFFENSFEEKDFPLFREIFDGNKTYVKLDFANELVLKPKLGYIDFSYHVFLSNNNNNKRTKIYYFELPGHKEKPEITFRRDKQIIFIKLNEEIHIPEGFICVEGHPRKNKNIQIKVSDDAYSRYIRYEVEKEFLTMENGLLKIQFIEVLEEDL